MERAIINSNLNYYKQMELGKKALRRKCKCESFFWKGTTGNSQRTPKTRNKY
jgi:hypothetical protein